MPLDLRLTDLGPETHFVFVRDIFVIFNVYISFISFHLEVGMMRFMWFVVFVLMGGVPVNAQVGTVVPDFSLEDLEGTTHMPTQYRGKVLVLFFFGHN